MVFSINTLASAMSGYGLFFVVCFLSQEFVSEISWEALQTRDNVLPKMLGQSHPVMYA